MSFIDAAQRAAKKKFPFEQVARVKGLDTEKVLKERGEEPKKIFSGGFISDIFDALNALQYGVVGVLKGKGFVEGVKTRQSFSDKDALGNFGIPGTIAGIGLDIAVDPLTWIAPMTLVKKIPGAAKGIKAAQKAIKASKVGKWLGSKFIYRFGQDKLYKELAERTIRNTAVGQRNLLELARPLTKLSPEVQRTISAARKAGKLTELPKEVLAKAKPAFDALDELGREAVEVGLLKKSVYEKNVGKYIARLYKTKEAPEKVLKGLFPRKPMRVDLSRFMKRKDIPDEVRQAMGEILEAGYPTAKTLTQLKKSIEQAKFFNSVAKKWGSDVAKEGFERLPNVKTLAGLADKYVPKPIFDDIQQIIKPVGKGITKKAVAGFKFGKVVMNPATHGRNIINNFILNNFEGLSPARIDIYAEAAKEMVRKGKWYQEAKDVGLGLDTFVAREIKDILTRGDAPGAMSKLGRAWRSLVDNLSKVYQGEENFAKLAQYIFQRKRGLSPEDAWRIAERATFNYAQVTPFIRRLRESIFGFPFITFTYKVTPQVAKTLITKPTKISNIGKIKNAIENMADLQELTRERATEPSWIRDGFYVKLPIKDKYGRSAYFDLTYILPFGDLISGQLLERRTERETGLPEGFAVAALRKAPLLNFISEIARNRDFYGDKIWKDADPTEKQLGDLMRHLMKTYLPPLVADQIPGGYKRGGGRRIKGFVGTLKPEGTTQRTLMEEVLRNVGLKISPVDVKLQEYFFEKDKDKALQTLMEEAGILQRFERPFLPKQRRSGGFGR